MDMKGRWGKVIGWPLAVAALVGQSFIGYVTENGQLPPWMPEKLGGLASWLSTDVSIPVWSLVLILVCVSAVGTLFYKFHSRAPSGVDGRLAEATLLLEASHQRNFGLEESNSLLHQQLHEKSKALEALQVTKLAVSDPGFAQLSSDHVLLETSYAALKETNADLQRQFDELSQARKAGEVEIPPFAFNTLNTIVNLTNRGFKPNMMLLHTTLGNRVEVEGAIDVLHENKMLQYMDIAGTTSYSLTPKGRAYYLEKKSK